MEFFLARQPIFNKQQKVFAYELLYRSGLNNYYDHWNGDHATSSVLTHSFITIGLDTLTRGKMAFINFTRNLLLKELATVFPNDLMAVEITENIEPDEEIVATCHKLKQLGYLLALDDFVFNPQLAPLIELVDIIKVDFVNTKPDERRSVIEKINSKKIKFLAEKVETIDEFNEAMEIGYSLFQGYFFAKPVIISGRDVPAYKLNYLQILQEVNRPELDYNQLEKIFKRDVTLSYKLLRYINSAFFGFPNKILSIRHALALLGLREAKKWLSLIALNSMGKDKSEELVLNSLMRANLCELLAPLVGLGDRASELFLMGLFSMIDAFLDQPLSDILVKLPICDDIKNALLGEKNRLRDVYDLVIFYEKGNWEQVFTLLSNYKSVEKELPALFIKTIEQANQIFPN